ncbi:MAG: DUF2779 domain-containing protein [Nitrospirae bacterium]|nr:DUF2779 domain-containing protein [Nitrospirota bacterium]
MANITLSKSRFMSGLQCPKNLYLSVFNKELATPTSPALQMIFDAGNEIGEEARKRFPGGVLVDTPYYALEEALEKTDELIAQGVNVLYEPSFFFNGLQVRVDILHRKTPTSPWEIIEVKSSTSVKDENRIDLAVQYYVLKKSGLDVQTGSLMFINNQCVYPNLKNLFIIEDLTAELEPLFPMIEENLSKFKSLLTQRTAPEVDVGPQCNDPNPCAFMAHCWGRLNLPNPGVMNLYMVGNKKFQYLKDGIVELTDPRLPVLKGIQKKMVDVAKSGQPFIDPKGIKEALKSWQYPFYFFDFETIGFAIPRYNGTSPYQQIPFQFSCDILENETAEIKHFEYLHDSSSDPRESVVAHILKVIGPVGSVFAYYHQFESARLGELAAAFPHYATRLKEIQTRLVDPLPVIKDHVYFHEFAGSFSLKDVAPAILGNKYRYSGEVKDGTEAQLGFLRLTTEELKPEEKESLKKALLAYCGQDTRGLVKLVEWLFSVASEN